MVCEAAVYKCIHYTPCVPNCVHKNSKFDVEFQTYKISSFHDVNNIRSPFVPNERVRFHIFSIRRADNLVVYVFIQQTFENNFISGHELCAPHRMHILKSELIETFSNVFNHH